MSPARSGRFRGYLLVSGALIASTAVFSGWLVGAFFEDHVLHHEEAQLADIVQTQAQQHLAPGVFEPSRDPAHAVMFETFLEGLPGVFRIKAFDPSGRIVWSNEPKLVGMEFPGNPSFLRALAGEATTVLGPPTQPEHLYERATLYVGEVYVPIRFRGSARIVGVIEAYKDMTALMAHIRRTQRRIWAATGGMGIFLYVALAFVVWRASAAEVRAIRRLEEQNRELMLLQEFTRSVLRPLDLGRVAESVVENAGARLGLSHAAIYRVDGGDDLAMLACWPTGSRDVLPPRTLVAEALQTRSQVFRGGTVAVPLQTPRETTYLFVGDLRDRAVGAGSPVVRTLEIMLDEFAIALANVELVGEIREAHERLAAILAGIADRMLIVDRQMRIVWMNTASAAAYGRGEEVLGASCFEVLGMGPETCANCPAIRTFLSGGIERGVRETRSPDGRVRHLDLVTAPLRDASGEVFQVLEVARDITELVEMEEDLKQTNRALRDAQVELVEKERLAAVGQLVVGLHHAILNPLAGILGALEVLKADRVGDADKARALAEAEAEIRKIERLVRQLPALRQAKGVPYVGETTMLDLERAVRTDPDRGV